MTKFEEEICKKIKDGDNDLLTYLSENCNEKLGAKLKGRLFEIISNVNEEGFSSFVTREQLVKINKHYNTTNGSEWTRETSYLGKKYNIKKIYNHGSVYAIRLLGLKDSVNYHNIPVTISNVLRKENCVILDIGTNIEIDHKDATYTTTNFVLSDFQPLCKTANDAKRQHCKVCRQTQERYDAKQLGYSVSFISGDKETKTCNGCYWYDPKEFNKEVSKNFLNGETK